MSEKVKTQEKSTQKPKSSEEIITHILWIVFITSVSWFTILLFFVQYPQYKLSKPLDILKIFKRIKTKPIPYDPHVLDEKTPLTQAELEQFQFNMWYSIEESKKYENYIQKAPSSIPNAGFGLFAQKDFKKGEKVIPCTGQIITFEDIDEHYSFHGQNHRELGTKNGRFYIVPYPNSTWDYVNHYYENQNVEFNEENFDYRKSDSPLKPNEITPGTNVLSITTLRPIKKGEEFFIDYGPDYDYESAGFKRK